MEKKYLDTNYVDGKRVSDVEETASQADDERYLGQLRERKANALDGLTKDPDNEFWKTELQKVNKEIVIYQKFVDDYPETAE